MDKKIMVTHRGTNERIGKIKKEMVIKSRKAERSSFWDKINEDTEQVVWISKGHPNLWNKIWSGMLGRKGEASVTLLMDEDRVRNPNRLKRFFGNSQLVIDGDVKIPEDAIFKFKD